MEFPVCEGQLMYPGYDPDLLEAEQDRAPAKPLPAIVVAALWLIGGVAAAWLVFWAMFYFLLHEKLGF